MRRKKVYKKFLSCVLAAAMVITSGVVYPGNGMAAEAAVQIKDNFQANNDTWRILENWNGATGVILDSQGVIYQLSQDAATATVVGFDYGSMVASSKADPIMSGIVTIPEEVPISYADNYKNYDGTATSLGSTNYVTPSKVTAIAENAFANSPDLTKVTVPENVTSIGDKAFASCGSLTEVTWNVPDGVSVKIGNESPDMSNAEILKDSPKSKLTSSNTYVLIYAKNKEYTSPRTDNSQPSPTPTDVPSEAPSNTPSGVPSDMPSGMPSGTPSEEPTATPSEAPTATPSATPVVTPSATPTATPTSTPKAPVYPPAPVVTPSVAPVTPTPVVVTVPPVDQTPTPGETTAPTTAPTAAVNTPAPPSENPTVTEVPEPAVTPAPADNTPVPVQPTKAPAQEETVVKNNVTYEIDTNKKSVSVSNMSNVKASTITIPATVKVDGVTYQVTTIEKGAFKNNTKIKEVKIGNNVKTIEAGAFRGCTKLTSVKLPSKLQTISKNSFNGCSKLSTVKIPKTVTRIGKAAFKDCTSLKSVSIGNKPAKTGGLSIDGKQVRYGASTVTINIGEKAFENCKKLNKVIINALVKIIGKSAFKDCKSLRSVLIYSKVLKKVKGGALTGVNNCKISVPAKKVGPYKILFKNKGQGKKVVVAKL